MALEWCNSVASRRDHAATASATSCYDDRTNEIHRSRRSATPTSDDTNHSCMCSHPSWNSTRRSLRIVADASDSVDSTCVNILDNWTSAFLPSDKPVDELARALLSFKRPARRRRCTVAIFRNFHLRGYAKCFFSQNSKRNELNFVTQCTTIVYA